MMHAFNNKLDFAKQLDKQDKLAHFRNQFHIPSKDGVELIYFCGNSLGLQPKAVKQALEIELEDWAKLGVEGHFDAKNPWFPYHEFLTESSAKIVGAKPLEVVCMNSLTVNLNLLMLSFYEPKGSRNKIAIEEHAFPSDRYAVQQMLRFHGLDPTEHMVVIKNQNGRHCLSNSMIENQLNAIGDSLALLMFGGVNYYTGQAFDMKRITQKAKDLGAKVGFDLAHAAGNLHMHLHNWGVDFAVWCSYKYLNSGPGGISGAFVHEKHANNPKLPRLAGWWGNNPNTRFQMPNEFIPQEGAAGWQMSNAPVLNMAAHWASLKIFDDAGIENLRTKGKELNSYLYYLIEDACQTSDLDLEIISPKDPNERGCQLSLLTSPNGKDLFNKITAAGVIADWREPNVIRVAPAPLYNTFEEVWRFVSLLKEAS